jgi:hypothetical protein
LDLTIGNMSAVTWLPDGGLDVNSATIIQSGSPVARLFNALTASNELTLEAWIIPESTQQDGPARILTLSEDPLLRNFTLGQEFDAFEIRLRTTTTDDNGFPPLSSPAGGATTNLSHVVYTRSTNGQGLLYINNSLVANETRSGNFSNWDNQYALALANELTSDRAWLGTFYLAAIYNRALSAAEVGQNYQAGAQPEASSSCDPTPTPPTPTSTVVSTNTPIPPATATATALPTTTNTPTSAPTSRSSPTATATASPAATNTPTSTATASPAATITNTPTATATVGCTPSPTAVPGSVRVTNGQQILYLFDAASGNIVTDTSGIQPPLDLTIANPTAVSWLPNGGLAVNQATIIQSGGPVTRLFEALSGSGELTLEAWIIPNNTGQNGPARILTFSENLFNRNFTLGQEFTTFDILLRTTTTDNNGFPLFASPTGSASANLSHIIYSRRANGTARLYINNQYVAGEVRNGSFANWNNQYQLALANELSLDRAWLGTFHLVAIYNRSLNSAEINQNYQAGPRPGGSNGCGASTPGSANHTLPNTEAEGVLSGIVSWVVGLFD